MFSDYSCYQITEEEFCNNICHVCKMHLLLMQIPNMTVALSYFKLRKLHFLSQYFSKVSYHFFISTCKLNVFVMFVIIFYVFRCESVFGIDTVKSTFLVLFLLRSVQIEYFIRYYFLSSSSAS
jgi:hypothetical protein